MRFTIPKHGLDVGGLHTRELNRIAAAIAAGGFRPDAKSAILYDLKANVKGLKSRLTSGYYKPIEWDNAMRQLLVDYRRIVGYLPA